MSTQDQRKAREWGVQIDSSGRIWTPRRGLDMGAENVIVREVLPNEPRLYTLQEIEEMTRPLLAACATIEAQFHWTNGINRDAYLTLKSALTQFQSLFTDPQKETKE